MDYIYAASFTDGSVKFGRSTDLWKRLYSLDSSARHQGNEIDYCFIAPVSDGVRIEREILNMASELLVNNSREGFKVESYADIGNVFHKIRLPYIFCEMGADTFGPVISINSFSPDLYVSNERNSNKATKKIDRIKVRILRTIENYSGSVTMNIFMNKLLNYNETDINQGLQELLNEGVIYPEEFTYAGSKKVKYHIA